DLVGLLPLAVRTRNWTHAFCPPTLEFLGTGHAGSDYLDVVARRGYERAVACALADHLDGEDRVLQLTHVPEGSVADLLASELRPRGWSLRGRPVELCPFIPLAGRSFEDYVAGLGAAHRSNFRRRMRSLEKRFAVGFEPARTESEREAALAVLIALHNDRWRARGGSDAFHTPALVAFHREMSRVALEKGWLRLFVLTLDGKPAAGLYGFLYGGTFYFYQSGFDTSLGSLSVGLVTMGLAIERAVEEGALEFDMLHGDESYKFLWAKEARSLRRLELVPHRARALLYQGANDIFRGAKSLARRVLPQVWADRLVALRRRMTALPH
ncbi:MAG TPA: GNAT family N-acetyltransferase, partial [Vicinamibacteria bacterium]|nr:GNAT family N-acetyltransferase [Vicinamibacteria bacterium]